MKRIYLMLLLLVIPGCMKTPVDDQSVIVKVHYFQDKRTRLCFAYWLDNTGCITQVPCNQAQPLLDNDWGH